MSRRRDPLASDLTPLHHAYFAALGAPAVLLGLAGLVEPTLLDLPPLHARCLGSMLLAQGLVWLLALREQDSACVRIPLAQALAAALAGVLAPLARGVTPGLAASGLAAGVAAGSALLLWHDRTLQAPAERADPALAGAGTVLALGAAALALAPGWSAAAWPWTLPARAALGYAVGFAGWGTGAALLARERRRGARRLALWGLGVLGLGVAAVSLLHLPTFASAVGATAWIAAFAALAALAAWRLRQRHYALHPLQH